MPARAAFDEHLMHYKAAIPQVFWFNALLIASNGTDSRVGSLTADWERFFEWKRIEREDEPRRVSLEVMLRGTCDRARLLDLVENFTLFSEHKAGLVKIIGQNHQFLGVNSQYDTLALNMRAALPKALFLAFTGTPLIAGEERTKDVFGDYVSIYDFQQSVEDGATVPLFYENRTPELQLVNPDLNEDIYNLIEAAELDPDQEAKLERELSRQYHILTRDDRLETVAQDIVRHFLGRGFIGKAMVVSIDKATALKMHDKVRKYWEMEIAVAKKQLGRYDLTEEKKAELMARLDVLQTTDMALIVSPGQNEIQQMQVRGLNIEPHRKRMNESSPPLDEKFKDADDPLRIVFLCAMWLTGFDAPSCSTVYLDKPMRNHTLMQTIARANRVPATCWTGSSNCLFSTGGKSPVRVLNSNLPSRTPSTPACLAPTTNPSTHKSAPPSSSTSSRATPNATPACTPRRVRLEATTQSALPRLAQEWKWCSRPDNYVDGSGFLPGLSSSRRMMMPTIIPWNDSPAPAPSS